jgi:hypothetical protein
MHFPTLQLGKRWNTPGHLGSHCVCGNLERIFQAKNGGSANNNLFCCLLLALTSNLKVLRMLPFQKLPSTLFKLQT